MSLSLQEEILFKPCLEKQSRIKSYFKDCTDPQDKYQKIIELGRSAPSFPQEYKIFENLVPGCQSIMYLHASIKDGRMVFMAGSEALISSGLAALLIQTYNDEPPETVLKCPPFFLDQLGIHASLTPTRSNGLSSLFLRMKQEALKCLMQPIKPLI